MKRNKEIITFGGNPVTLIGDLITVGKQAPEFRAIDKDMNEKNY